MCTSPNVFATRGVGHRRISNRPRKCWAIDEHLLEETFGTPQSNRDDSEEPTLDLEDAGVEYMKNADLQITCDLGVGDGTATVWTCDLTHQYIMINADYRS